MCRCVKMAGRAVQHSTVSPCPAVSQGRAGLRRLGRHRRTQCGAVRRTPAGSRICRCNATFRNWVEGRPATGVFTPTGMRATGDGNVFDGSFRADRTQFAARRPDGPVSHDRAGGCSTRRWRLQGSGSATCRAPMRRGSAAVVTGSCGCRRCVCQPLTQNTQDGGTTASPRNLSGATAFPHRPDPAPPGPRHRPALLGWSHDVDGYAVDGTLVQGATCHQPSSCEPYSSVYFYRNRAHLGQFQYGLR